MSFSVAAREDAFDVFCGEERHGIAGFHHSTANIGVTRCNFSFLEGRRQILFPMDGTPTCINKNRFRNSLAAPPFLVFGVRGAINAQEV